MKPCIGIAGWKNSGKTQLVASLVEAFAKRGMNVSTLKHAHHSFDLDQQGTDSHRHRTAGAREVVLVSGSRWAIQHELGETPEPSFLEIIERMSPCDLVLVEGYKSEPIPKIEIIGSNSDGKRLWPQDPNVIAIASDTPLKACPLPQFKRNETSKIADFVSERLNLKP